MNDAIWYLLLAASGALLAWLNVRKILEDEMKFDGQAPEINVKPVTKVEMLERLQNELESLDAGPERARVLTEIVKLSEE